MCFKSYLGIQLSDQIISLLSVSKIRCLGSVCGSHKVILIDISDACMICIHGWCHLVLCWELVLWHIFQLNLAALVNNRHDIIEGNFTWLDYINSYMYVFMCIDTHRCLLFHFLYM